MIVAVLDPGVLAAGWTIAGGLPDRIRRLWIAGAFELVVSEHILDELAKTLAKPCFRRRSAAGPVWEALALLRERAMVVPLTLDVRGVAAHSEDDLVLATAVGGRAGYLVTGDKELRRLGSYQGARVVTPRPTRGRPSRPTTVDLDRR